MSRITRLRWAMVGLLIGTLGVCPAWGEVDGKLLSTEEIAQACGSPGTGDCLEPNGSPYCENEACCEAVCTVDPYCCTTEWDLGCVNLTDELLVECRTCGSPDMGDCWTANGTPYCENAACCEAVCTLDSYCCNTEWDEVCAGLTAQLHAECGTGVELLSAVSRKVHGDAGTFDIDLPVNTYTDTGIESRSGGPTQVVLNFSGPTERISIQTTGGSVDAVVADGSELTVELSGVPNPTCLTLRASGIPGMLASVRIRCLEGDARTDGQIDILDLVNIRNRLNQPVTLANFRADVSADGATNILDLVQVRNCLNSTVECAPLAPETMVLIPAGEYQMGDTFNEGSSDGRERPVHAVYVDAFYMDRYEVTNQQYADALNWALNQGNLINVSNGVVYQAGSGTSFLYCDTTLSTPGSRITWDAQVFGVEAWKENHPMVQVSWYGAAAYCNWRSAMEGKTPCYNLSTWECNFDTNGYRLPTEAEWEKGARGGLAGQRFPWGNTIQHTWANYLSRSSYSYDTSPTRDYHPLWGVSPSPYTSPVGFFDGSLRYKADFNWPGSATSYQTANAANGYGLHDMTGNVHGWCNDWYSSTYYSRSPHSNPRGPTSGTERVLRGGSWYNYAANCRAATRAGYTPDTRRSRYGFRCATGT